MTQESGRLAHPPIIEAVVDIDCNFIPELVLSTIEDEAKAAYQPEYPIFRKQRLWRQEIAMREDGPPKAPAAQGSVRAYQFLQHDERQLVQVRQRGFSFNRLAPYSTLDDYIADIESAWRRFVDLARPIKISAVRLRYINKLELPIDGVALDSYFKCGPRIPDEDNLSFIGFVNQYTAVENETGFRAQTILATQASTEGKLPVIFDITATCDESIEPNDWTTALSRIEALRDLKNRVFYSTLEEKCLQLYR